MFLAFSAFSSCFMFSSLLFPFPLGIDCHCSSEHAQPVWRMLFFHLPSDMIIGFFKVFSSTPDPSRDCRWEGSHPFKELQQSCYWSLSLPLNKRNCNRGQPFCFNTQYLPNRRPHICAQKHIQQPEANAVTTAVVEATDIFAISIYNSSGYQLPFLVVVATSSSYTSNWTLRPLTRH